MTGTSAINIVGHELADPRLVLLYDYWASKCDGRPAPRRQDIDPLEIPRLLPILHLIAVEHDPLVFRHRLIGTDIVEKMGRDATGQPVGVGLYGPAAAEIVETLTTIVEEVRPYRRRARLDWHDRRWLTVESLELPLVDAGGRVSTILRGAAFGGTRPPQAERLRFEPFEP
ncbi:PAS domain-containing protein [Tistlia consotensis]|uniref:PAS domain-containing protein n=1 Tax=Tistlia consotensis USBA 355 TaxID=560819 RepID=A0A1Y6BKG9_9PROT|nr:PAS domain-containing protein [Tistlia consotensis]SMF14550.1 PAS domain-containing protein [Tistlia consotensis USBA 355]SNR49453.1 PAS domain-containing protein [Tistlia consotensis]